ncbi:MAG: CDP-alcohol phosphatidyltransferase family protein [Methanocorpusculum sp.]|uniref:CDP-alcohol phosphatidyltransferase family protein n=1 Tax=Methanocorpusculum petauri TaxID=3002863 RepID=A0ABT4IGL0_9EURY|nr:CDP-alcohol phosphatidyltransferase family protein [Methanocorpusculum petauri]MDE2444028.1 CDP-alcohol phosphatidyltransferase family protein [Methanocorpusculum sp.]MCZ0860872.1 CDP-alcohol phosphatidyltransferase family protein [Methanocorpusculum petauri]MDE2518875.1 CDP-alcohol phosphatidyltransferase family protein [Methanocorpusculum sp.]MDE2523170.1 CDP-alcohol phosphatidyltransferase family protein [Methanocorpusculum sp.]MDE2525034.1 CDP-alcohol phosphatidyltransferase family prot
MNITALRPRLIGCIDPIGNAFVRIGLKPNQITILSLVFGIACAVCYMQRLFLLGSILLAVSAILDLVDGNVARKTNRKSDFGAVLDWIIDKYVDGLVLLGIGLSGTAVISQFFTVPSWVDTAIVGLAIIGSLMNTFIKPVTYAEIGYTKKEDGKISDPLEGIGFFGRPETIICLILFGLISQIWIAVILIAVCTNLSALQRILYLARRHGAYKEE